MVHSWSHTIWKFVRRSNLQPFVPNRCKIGLSLLGDLCPGRRAAAAATGEDQAVEESRAKHIVLVARIPDVIFYPVFPYGTRFFALNDRDQ